MSVVFSGYESLIFAYISLVFIILLLQYCVYETKQGSFNNWIKTGFVYAIPLFLGLLFRFVIGYSLVFLNGLTIDNFGAATEIMWLEYPENALMQLLFNGWYYGIRALSYFPITEFVISLLIFIVYLIILIKNRKKNTSIALFLILSLFLLPIIQGAHFGYRTAQTVQLFVAFIAYLLVDLSNKYSDLCKKTVLVLLMFLSLRQSIYLHQVLALNNQRSENEAYIARTIGYELYKSFDIEKTVVFVGDYQLGNNLKSQIKVDRNSLAGRIETDLRRRFGFEDEIYDINILSGNVQSHFNWAKTAFSSQKMLQNYFSYYGFDIKVLENMSEKKMNNYEKIAKDNNMKAYDILDIGDYIIVCLGWN